MKRGAHAGLLGHGQNRLREIRVVRPHVFRTELAPEGEREVARQVAVEGGHDRSSAAEPGPGAVEGVGPKVVGQDWDAGSAHRPDGGLVVLDLAVAARQAQARFVDEPGWRVLNRTYLQAEALDPLAQPCQVRVLPALLSRQVGRRGQDDLLAAHLFGEDEVPVVGLRWQTDRDAHLLRHDLALLDSPLRGVAGLRRTKRPRARSCQVPSGTARRHAGQYRHAAPFSPLHCSHCVSGH